MGLFGILAGAVVLGTLAGNGKSNKKKKNKNKGKKQSYSARQHGYDYEDYDDDLDDDYTGRYSANRSGAGDIGQTYRVKREIQQCPKDWVYPGAVPTFEGIEAGGHEDPRALVYTLLDLNMDRKRFLSDKELSARDFKTNRTAYNQLLKKELIEKPEPAEELVALMSKDELIEAALELGVSKNGKKLQIAERLIEGGYKVNRKKYKSRLFRVTEKGKEAIARCKEDRHQSIQSAIEALMYLDYDKAVKAYRTFDCTWGYAHTSEKIHTIFAYYDIPKSRFSFFERYPMLELNNTDRFKRTLRATLIVGLMRGCTDSFELRKDFERVCDEPIRCPGLLNLFDYENAIKAIMWNNIQDNPGKALEYYISHMEYLSRHFDE